MAPKSPRFSASRKILRLVEAAMALGVTKVRLTGGEPLLRKNLDRLIRMLVDLPALDDISLTTNGLLLGDQAPALHAAGLRRINVSLDSLDANTFRQIAKRGSLQQVLSSLENRRPLLRRSGQGQRGDYARHQRSRDRGIRRSRSSPFF